MFQAHEATLEYIEPFASSDSPTSESSPESLSKISAEEIEVTSAVDGET